MPVMTNEQPIVAGYGDIFTAPVGTPIPTDIAAPAAPWVKLGMISEDGASWTPPEEETEDIKIWQSPYPARVVTTGLTSSLTFALDGWDRNTVPFALGGGSFADQGSNVVFTPPGAGESVSRAIFMKVLDGSEADGVKLGLYFAKGRVVSRDDTVFNASEPALLNVEFGLETLVDPNGDVVPPYNLVFDQATFPAAPIAATGATAGSPGTFTPPGAEVPADLSAMTGLTASPATAWTTGQHVVLGDASQAHWNGTAWATGGATVLGAEGQSEGGRR